MYDKPLGPDNLCDRCDYEDWSETVDFSGYHDPFMGELVGGVFLLLIGVLLIAGLSVLLGL